MNKELISEAVDKPIAGDPLGVTVHVLSNGLTVYLSPNTQEPRVYYEIAVRAGSRHDPLEATGMAHYLEHMQFKGTNRLGTSDFGHEKSRLDLIEELYEELFETENQKQRLDIYSRIDRESQAAAKFAIANELDRLYSAVGFNAINAHTSQDETVYKGCFPSNRAEVWAAVEADRLTTPIYRLFLPELETVYEEFNKRNDEAENEFHRAALSAMFDGHPYGRDIIGLGAHLKNPSISRMRSFFRAYYRPNNMAIILSGDFNRPDMLDLIKRYFGKLEPAEIPPAPKGEIKAPRGVRKTEILYQAEEKVGIGWLICGHGHPDEDAVIVMDMLMDNRWTGILNLSVNKAQKVKTSGAQPIIFNEAGEWLMWAVAKAGQTLEQAEDVLLQAVAKLKAGDFTDEDIRAVVTDFEVNEKKRLEKNSERVGHIRRAFIEGEPWPDAVRRLERLKKVAKKDVLAAAKKYLGDDRVVIYRRKGEPVVESVAKPEFTALDIDAGRQSPFFSQLLTLPAKPLAPRFLKEGRDYRILPRPWGRLYWTENPVNDLFHLEFRFTLGRTHDKKLKLALKFLELCGAGGMTVDDFQRALYQLGSKLEVESGERECVVLLSGLEKNLTETLRLALLRFSKPKVAAGAFERMIAVERGDRKNRKLDPNKIFHALSDFAARGAESSVLGDLSPKELDALTEADLTAVLGSLFEYPRSALYTGCLRAEDAAGLLDKAQALKVRPEPAKKIFKLIVPGSSRVIFVHRDNLNQAVIGAYAADGPYEADARVDYRIFNAVMGGMSGVYFQEVREARALAYAAAGGYGPGERKGDDNSLWSYAGTQCDKAAETSLLLAELMAHPPITPERFVSAVREAEESYRTESPTLSDIPRQIDRWHKLGFDVDPRIESLGRLESYKQAELNRFAERFSSKPLTFYILADRSRVELKALEALGKLEERAVDELFPF
jgi:predicted Zn-dependent peptidase